MRQEAIPFGQREFCVNGAKDGYEMIFERPDGSFGGIDSVFFRGDALETNLIPLKSVFKVLGTFVVEDVELRRMPLVDQELVCGFPCVADAGSLSVGYGHCVNGVGVLVV